ncbi:MAG: hypothetical protein A4E73_01055 [Syntrophaceae bacterium PtaU1.Bin231]|nr:MAG: hypothetical protein A4E73_01055 [Syntrophaceae bacterium PtaU1.Bin231]
MRPGMPMTDGTAKEARLRMITSVKAARIAGRRIGSVTRRSVLRFEAPQTFDDSSRETSNAAMAGATIR